jgi:ribosomal protein S18 acetylase RimI-like enzyme
MTGELEIRRARPEELEEVVGVLSENARWLLSRGIRQWPDPFPAGRVEQLLERGEFYVGRLDGEIVATLALLWSDPAFWGERAPDAGYVHALAVRRAYAGRRIGPRLLDWAEAQAAAAGREYLRLDCPRENAVLRAYYEGQGFEPQGEVELDDLTVTLLQRRCRARAAGPAGTVE